MFRSAKSALKFGNYLLLGSMSIATVAGLQGETLRVLQLSLRDHQTVLYTQALPGQEYGRACQARVLI
ncbi:unnamed protein product [Anisakis simplex]|uniref:Secreted protein n=1 Tax=Anisakis simplex TaxID=6269 RepID=A0A0M3JKD6_ANISI|nr:unnamed protein product [Anisakis simplex]